jgi:ubiquinone biosynthesis protein Coq4
MVTLLILYNLFKRKIKAYFIFLCCFFNPSKILKLEVGMMLYGNTITKSSFKFLEKFFHHENAQILFKDDRCVLAERLSDKEYLNSLPENSLGKLYYNLVFNQTTGQLSTNYVELLDKNRKVGPFKKVRSDETDKYDSLKKKLNIADKTLCQLLLQHDLMHILTNTSSDSEGELYLHAFFLKQIQLRGPKLLALSLAFNEIILNLNFKALKQSIKYYKIGKEADWLLPVDWANLLHVDVFELRKRFNITL